MLGHDPYGQRRDEDWEARLTPAEIEALRAEHGERVSRGFTGHEHLDRTGLVHMNGRVYDPRLGRFLSPDPIVGDPTSSQSWNLYSYVGNNPLSHVDPSGLTLCDPRICNRTSATPGGGWLGGGSTTRSQTVTVSEIVYGTVSIWRRGVYAGGWHGWDPVLNEPAWDTTLYEFWDLIQVALPFVASGTVTVAVEDQSVADQPEEESTTKPMGVTVDTSVDGDSHRYAISVRLCRKSAVCDEAWADRVYDYVNRRDVPYSSDDLGEGQKNILLGTQPIEHEEHLSARRSVNRTREGHELHPGQVVHDVGFRPDGHLYYDIVGTGSGGDPDFANAVGVFTFIGTARDVVHRFGSPPTVRRYPMNMQIYP